MLSEGYDGKYFMCRQSFFTQCAAAPSSLPNQETQVMAHMVLTVFLSLRPLISDNVWADLSVGFQWSTFSVRFSIIPAVTLHTKATFSCACFMYCEMSSWNWLLFVLASFNNFSVTRTSQTTLSFGFYGAHGIMSRWSERLADWPLIN